MEQTIHQYPYSFSYECLKKKRCLDMPRSAKSIRILRDVGKVGPQRGPLSKFVLHNNADPRIDSTQSTPP